MIRGPLRTFRSQRLIAFLNIMTTGSALAAIVATLFRSLFNQQDMAISGVSTFVTGTIWAAAMRAQRASVGCFRRCSRAPTRFSA